jgi:hypothetical protein
MSAAKILTDREALEKFRELHPELSIHNIAAISENEFVQKYAKDFAGGVRQARRSHKTATLIQQRTAILWANIKDAASPLIRNALFNNVPQEFLDYQELIPGYNRLFGSLDYIECNHCRSVLSPAAYFVDLMRFVEETITDNIDNSIPENCQLDWRRPDLFQLKLDCDNTNTLIPYIDLVNTALETLVTTAEKPEATEVLAETIFPTNLPLNFPLSEIRVYLEQLKLDFQQVYQVFQTDSFEQKQSIVREILSLSPREFKLISDESSNPAEISQFYDVDLTSDGLQTLANVEAFLDRTGFNRQELNDLIFQDLNQQEINLGLSRLFFINSADDGLGYLRIEQGQSNPENPTRPPLETLVNLSSAKLARIYRFLKLSRQLGWSFSDLDWALRSLFQPYTPETSLQFDGINDYVQVSLSDSTNRENNRLNLTNLQDTFTLEAWVNPTQNRLNPILSQGREQDHSTHFLVWIDEAGKLAFYADALGNSNSDYPRSWQSLPVGQFSHVAVTVEPQELTFYINGQRDRKIPLSQAITPPVTPEDVNIGRNLNDCHFEGTIKEVRIWSEVRSAIEIAENRYRRLTGYENDLVAYWPLVEHPSRQLLDVTPNQNHGIMGGEEFVTQPRWTQEDLVLESFPIAIGSPVYQFNGIDQYLAARGVTGLTTNQLTLEAWIRLEEQGENYIISKGDEGNQQTQFLLWVNPQGQLVFQSTSLENAREYSSQTSISLQEPTHVSVTVAEDTVRLYLNGILNREYALSSPPILDPQGDDLNIGRNFSGQYFNGHIYEVRLWNYARTVEQLNQYQHRVLPVDAPGLIGYWRLNQIEDGLAPDLSYNQNHLYLGGIPADYQPDRVEVERLLPDLPIATTGTVLELDGDRDTIVIRHPDYIGLGHYEQITLELWFRPQELNLRNDHQQIIFTQGDEEAGLNLYLYQQRLYVIAWCAEYQGVNVQETVWVSEELASEQWHHIAVVNDESQSLDFIEFKAYLNDTELSFDRSSHLNTTLDNAQKGFRLSPVGAAYLGGLVEPRITRFQGEYSEAETRHCHCFKGQIAHVRLWQRRKSDREIQAERYTAPSENAADLVAYFPLNEGKGSTFQDLGGQGYTGHLLGKDLVFVGQSADVELENIHSHYQPEGVDVLAWSNYVYAGRFYVAEPTDIEAESGLGVTFFSRHPEAIDQYYRFQVLWQNGQPRFGLAAHPQGVQPLTLNPDAADFPVPTPNTWYRFRIKVENNQSEQRTDIRVKVWPENTPESAAVEIAAYDDSDVRITAGTVGLWVQGQTDSNWFDNLRVSPLSENGQEAASLLYENFKTYLPQQDPIGWIDTGDRITPQDATHLFQTLTVQGKSVLGTDSPLDNIHAHYTPDRVDVLAWTNYAYIGQIQITEETSGIGLTVCSRYPEGIDQYYSLRRDASQSTFQLTAHPQGVQPVSGQTDSGVNPQINTWYRFWIEVTDEGDRTRIQAKIWQDGTLEPEDFQIDAYDESDIRITSGTVGVWASGEGSKYFDQLNVFAETLLDENFESYSPEETPVNWLNTRRNNSREEDQNLFQTAQQEGNIVFGTRSTDLNIHSHYNAEGVLNWTNYLYRGKLRGVREDGERSDIGIGVTFFSRFPVESDDEDRYNLYYRLRVTRGNQEFHLATHRGRSGSGGRNVDGTRDSGVQFSEDTGYQFWIEVEDNTATDTTYIRAKVWPEGTPEPKEFQINAFDRGDNRFTSGTVGLWTGHRGTKYFDNLQVRQGVLFWTNYDLADWQATGSRDRYEPNQPLFQTDLVNDNPLWLTVQDYPLLLNPLNLHALQFDGVREYLAAEQLTGLELNAFTLEAWVNPFQDKANPVLSWNIGEQIAWFGIDSARKLVLTNGTESVTGTANVPTNQFSHIALSVEGDRVTFYVNGTEDARASLSSAIALSGNSLEMGRDLGEQYFAGQIRDVRIWQNPRSEAQFVPGIRYQQPQPEAAELVAYWSFAQFADAETLDASPNQNHLRLGGLERARKPLLITQTEAPDFWRPDRAIVDFNNPDRTVVFTDNQAAQTIDRRTIEVWFKVEDQYITHRKQVIYHEGNDQQGLMIYVHDGYLYFGGYHSASDYSNWEGTWLKTDRIASNRWHHAALVLDGRAELRPHAFQGFLDGKLAGIGAGSQLREHHHSFTLAGVRGSVRFHDGNSEETAHHLQGQVMELRIWSTALTPEQIAERRYQQLTGDEPNLFLWWQFDEVINQEIPDLSGNNRVAIVPESEQLQQLGEPTLTVLPPVSLNAATLEGLATIRQLQERHNLPIERLTALWFSIKHVGQEEGQTLYDRLFNPTGITAEPWPYYPHPPIRWDVTGQENQRRDREIRSRLMAALQVSSQDLDRIVQYLSGSETPVELDNTYLTQLYRLAQIAKALRLQLRELFRLLELMELAGVNTLEEFQQVSDRAELMRRIGISIDELDFLINDIQSDRIRLSYTDTDIRNLADDLTRQSTEFLIRVSSFVSEEISEFLSTEIIENLEKSDLLQPVGDVRVAISENQYSVTDKYQEPGDLEALAIEQNWAVSFVTEEVEGVDLASFTRLQESGFVDTNGIILRQDLDQFSEAFRDEDNNLILNPTALANIQDVLERQNNLQTAITETLTRSRDEHANAVLAGLSELLGVEPEPLQAVVEYFQEIGEPLSDRTLFLEGLMQIQENQPLPADITEYLYHLSKILYLVGEFELTTAETQTLLRNPDLFSVSDVFRPNLTDLTNLFTFTELKSAFNDVEGNLIEVFEQSQRQEIINRIVELTNWERRQIEALMDYFGSNIAYNRVVGLNRLRQGFELAETLQTDISFLIELANADNLTLQFYQQQSSALLQVLRARYDDEQWPRVYRPLRDRLALQKRDALLSLAVYQNIPEDFEGRRSPDLLSEYLLLDVQVGTEVETSHIVQGTAALQLYVQRCLMSLEKGVNPATIPADQWEWMKNYRVWEANRKVFLYPESYIEPELRDTKTPLFEELEQELMQNDINQDAVARAYTRYLNKFTEIANLKIVGSYRHKPLSNNENASQDEILYLVGRTDSQPTGYYYRELINGSQWLPWKQIDLVIDSEHVSPVYAFGRLFLFWSELMQSSQPVDIGPVVITPADESDRGNQSLQGEGITQRDIDDYRAGRKSIDAQGFLFSETTGERVQRNIDVYRPTIKYSYLDADQTWITPQTYVEVGRSLREEEVVLPEWQRVSVLRSLNLGQENGIPSESNAQVLEIDSNTLILNRIPRFDMRRLTWSFWVKVDNQQLGGFLGSNSPVSPMVRIFDYGNVLSANSTANITPIAGLRTAVQLAMSTAVTVRIPISRLQNPDEEIRTEAENVLRDIIIDRLQQVIDSANSTAPNFPASVNRLTTAATNLRNAITAYFDNGTSISIQLVDELEQVATQTPQWETVTWKLQFFEPNSTSEEIIDVSLEYGVWQHIAVTFDYQQTGRYEVSLYAARNQAETPSTPSATGQLENLLPNAQILTIGKSFVNALLDSSFAINFPNRQANPLNHVFTAQLSEFRLWEQVREPGVINAEKDARLTGRELGLFYLPLNRPPQSNFPYGENQSPFRTLLANRNTLVSSSLSFRITSIIPIDLGRERIILFYGNMVRSIRNNLEEQSFNLQLENRFENITNYDVNLSLFSETGFASGSLPNSRGLILHLALTNGLSFNDYVDGEHSTLNRFTPANLRALQEQVNNVSIQLLLEPLLDIIREIEANEFASQNLLLRNLPRYEASVIDVGNQPGWYILDTGDEQYLVQINIDNLKTAGERLRIEYSQSKVGDVRQQIVVYFDQDEALETTDPDSETNLPLFRFERLSTFAVHELSFILFTKGIDGLLSLDAQRTEEIDFDSYQPFSYDSGSGIGLVLARDIPKTIDFEGAYGLYYREIFFHIPFFIANQLNTNQNFADSQRWYHYIFNPTASESNNSLGFNPDRFWQYLPLRNLSLETLRQILENNEALAEYQNDPFDPHAIARLRINAYQKAIVMKYIDNLLDWGDNLFAQDSRESINEAFLLYVLAFNLLGSRPEARATQQFQEIGNYEGIRDTFDDVPEFLTELDLNGNVAGRTSTITLNQNGNIITTFCVPENAELISFWDRVEDRLFKIRHSLNIEGIFRQLPLFQPPLDVRALVQAFASGGRDIGSLLSDLNVAVPHYRYSFMLDRAKEMIGNVKDFGAALLDVLEKRDAEQLAVLQTTHERNILNLTTAIRETARDEARETIEVLGISRQRITNRRDHFQVLIDNGLNNEELAELSLMGIAQGIKGIAAPYAGVAGILKSLPEVESGTVAPLPLATVAQDGEAFAAIIEAGVKIAEVTADTIETAASITGKVGEYKRRENDWNLELQTAEFDLEEVNQQIEIAQIQLQMAERELEIHNRQIEQNQEIADFYRRKFTNEALYNWMISRLSGLYFQAYKLAYDFAKSAERALQYELPTNERFISFGHWDSLRRGLLAGESLMLDLNRMEKFHLDNDSRFQEIEKVISLRREQEKGRELGEVLGNLKENGESEFRLTETLFNRDYPGHYFRVIKAMAISVKFRDDLDEAKRKELAYLSINATLTQMGNKTLLDPDINAVKYLMGIEGSEQPSGSTLRVNWRSNQQIAISHVNEKDYGMFTLNFFLDDRYFPFEGTGVVSNWHLEMPKANNLDIDFNDIEDVIIHLKYTSKSDRGAFKQAVQAEMQNLAT